MITIDLRGKTVEEVVALVKHHKVGRGEIGEGTHLWPGVPDERYERVVIVWLVSDHTISEPTVPVFYVLWDGNHCPYGQGDDLHGFVRMDGGIDWGKAHTMNMMR